MSIMSFIYSLLRRVFHYNVHMFTGISYTDSKVKTTLMHDLKQTQKKWKICYRNSCYRKIPELSHFTTVLFVKRTHVQNHSSILSDKTFI